MSVEGQAPSGRIGDGLAADLDRPAPAEEIIYEWQATPKTNGYWVVWSIPVAVAGTFAYGTVAIGSSPTQSSFPLLPLIVAVAAVFGLHEAIHGIVIAAFGARPEFGVVRTTSGWGVAFYATARGHLFTRRQYLIVTAAPMVILSLAGIPACLSPLGPYLWFPFAWHLGGCVGDAIIVWRTLRQPAGVLCQDLDDGTRFVRRRAAVRTDDFRERSNRSGVGCWHGRVRRLRR
jgi:hypothetical protein